MRQECNGDLSRERDFKSREWSSSMAQLLCEYSSKSWFVMSVCVCVCMCGCMDVDVCTFAAMSVYGICLYKHYLCTNTIIHRNTKNGKQ